MCGVENDLETCCLIVGFVFLVINCALLSKWLSPDFHLSMSFALYLRHGCGKRMYHFEGRIARRDGYYISRDVSRAVMDSTFRGTYRAPRRLLLSRVVSCAATDTWTDMSPMGPGLRDSGCVSLRKTCITIFDIASHGITHFIIDELEHVFC